MSLRRCGYAISRGSKVYRFVRSSDFRRFACFFSFALNKGAFFASFRTSLDFDINELVTMILSFHDLKEIHLREKNMQTPCGFKQSNRNSYEKL